MSFEKSGLWLASQDGIIDEHKEHAERLRSELRKTRTKAAQLTERIAATFPGLTVHDVTHLDALWEIASQIAGMGYRLNPLESYVFGMAVLLHDAALCFEAYDGGQKAVRATTAWKDALALERQRQQEVSEERSESAADFAAVRHLHAKQAAGLAVRHWDDPQTGDRLYLIEDSHLRKHLGPLLGDIAASHHWSIEEVKSKLPRQFNPPGAFPASWHIEPRKIACLLRCADALHLDNRRAPDFFHALLARHGVSFQHWQAQNQIGRITLDASDRTGSTLLISATYPFEETNAASWWVVYDAACVAQRELESSNGLLMADGSPLFSAKRICGVESPEQMAAHVRPKGWSPCSAGIHISNVEQLIGSLGGRHLYGADSDPVAVAVRELVQNARDAIKARQKFEKTFSGEISVSVSNTTPAILEVRDNGVGMSRRVLTGPLLDFGTSFWASSLVQSEFPGLVSSGFSPAGKFGVGFFSVFMAGHSVTVTSRRWDDGLDATHRLLFTGGLAQRPILKEGRVEGMDTTTSTVVRLILNADAVTEDRSVIIKSSSAHGAEFKVSLKDYLSIIVAGLDVDVTISVEGSGSVKHLKQPLEPAAREEWLGRIFFSQYRKDVLAAPLVRDASARLRPLFDKARCVGLAAISTSPQPRLPFASVSTVNGFAVTATGDRANFYVGFIDHFPASAKREQGERVASRQAIADWGQEQLELLRRAHLNDLQRASAAYGFAQFGIDPSEIARIAVRSEDAVEFLAIPQLVERLRTTPLLFWKATIHDHVDTFAVHIKLQNFLIFHPIDNGDFNALKFENGLPSVRGSAAWCLNQAIQHAGYRPVWEVRQNMTRSIIGDVHGLILRALPAA